MKHEKKTAVVLFLYTEAFIYLNQLLSSINQQSYSDFDLVIFNDGLDVVKLTEVLSTCITSINVRVISVRGTIPIIRQNALEFLKYEDYQFVIWVDADDFIESNRVEVVVDKLGMYDIIVNDLNIISANGMLMEANYLSNRLKLDHEISLDQIRNVNFIGFSNSAFNMKKLSKIVPIPNNLIAIDWYFYYILLSKGFSAIFTNETATNYRQHGDNIAGFKEINQISIKRGIHVKAKHFEALATYEDACIAEYYFYKQLVGCNDEIEKRIEYILNQKANGFLSNKPLWWEYC